jgi:hypothetical protein
MEGKEIFIVPEFDCRHQSRRSENRRADHDKPARTPQGESNQSSR